MTWEDEQGRRDAVIIITAVKGDVRAARGVVSRALRRALRLKKLGAPPHSVTYYSSAEIAADIPGTDNPRYTLKVTDEEMQRLADLIIEEARVEGFDRPPVEIYHD